MKTKVNEDPAWLVGQWTNWITKALASSKISKGKLAEMADFNASYLSLMVKGTIPRRQVVQALGKALGKEHEALLMAGYVPHRGFITALVRSMRHEAGRTLVQPGGLWWLGHHETCNCAICQHGRSHLKKS